MKLNHLTCVLLATLSMTLVTRTWAENTPTLRVSENGRFLVQPDGSAFFPIADTAWAITWRLTRDEVDRYLTRRKEQKFNTIALVAFPSYDGMKIYPNAYGDLPFEVINDAWNPLNPTITPGNTSTEPTEYDYWDHLEFIIDSANAKGLHVVLLPTWGGYIAGSYVKGEPSAEIIFDTRSAYTYGHWIGQRFSGKTNIIWMMGGDRSAVYGERDYRDVFRAMAEGVTDGVNGVNEQNGQADFSKTSMSYHPRKWHPNSSEWFHDDPWLDFNSTQDQPKDQIAAMNVDYGRTPAKPTWLFEGGYENRRRGDDIYKDWQIRFQAYQTVFAGAFGTTYGSMNIYHCGGGVLALDEPVTAGVTTAFEASMEEPGALDMQHLVYLMTTMSKEQFTERIPDQTLIDGDAGGFGAGEGVQSSRLEATRGTKGDYALVYTANGRNIRVKMDVLAPQRMHAYWFNPRNGNWQVGDTESADQKPFMENVPSGPGAPIQEFDPPGDTADENDWVLVLKVVE